MMSSAVMIVLGVGRPAALSRAAANGVEQLVTMAQRSAGRVFMAVVAPGRAVTSRVSTKFPASFPHPPGGNTVTGADLGVVKPLCHVQIGHRGGVHEQRWNRRPLGVHGDAVHA